MIVIYIIGAIVLLLLIIALFVSKEMLYEKSIAVAAPASKVWKQVSSHKAMDQWSPWDARDPNMQKTLTGTDGTVGAKQAWVSKEKNVGEGSQTFLTLDEPRLVETRIEFLKPFKSRANAWVKLTEEKKDTIVTWGFKSTMPYPMNLMKLFMNFEKSMDKDFGQGLNKLKDICEK
ncbi:MAG: SRPBCC family protein [Bacteroidales bacterium]|nr:SRPBCC family protein [Bacteroidales bacterium]MCF8404509.1 SRPBCC family protein [Bacteroidales bacterium]